MPEFVHSGILSFWTIKKTLKEICEKAKGWLIEISPEQNQAGMENFKDLVCEGVEDAEEVEDVEEAKDETESGFQTNFLSATLIALCALFKL